MQRKISLQGILFFLRSIKYQNNFPSANESDIFSAPRKAEKGKQTKARFVSRNSLKYERLRIIFFLSWFRISITSRIRRFTDKKKNEQFLLSLMIINIPSLRKKIISEVFLRMSLKCFFILSLSSSAKLQMCCTNSGFKYENPLNSVWSRFIIKSLSVGVRSVFSDVNWRSKLDTSLRCFCWGGRKERMLSE